MRAFVTGVRVMLVLSLVGFIPLPAALAGDAAEEKQPTLLELWSDLVEEDETWRQVTELFAYLDAHGLNDPESPVRLERPFPKDPQLAALDATLRLSSGEFRTLVEPGVGANLARRLDYALAYAFRGVAEQGIRLELDYGGDANRGGRLALTIANVSKDTMRDLRVHAITSTLEGPLESVMRGGGQPLVHTLRLVPGDLSSLALGSLDPGKSATASAAYDPEHLRIDDSTHVYYLISYRDAAGTLRTALPRPAQVTRKSADDSELPCPAARDGLLISTDQYTCLDLLHQRVGRWRGPQRQRLALRRHPGEAPHLG